MGMNNEANVIHGYTNKVPSGSQSPMEGDPPTALSHRLRGLRKNQGFETHAGGFCLCRRGF